MTKKVPVKKSKPTKKDITPEEVVIEEIVQKDPSW